MGTKTRIPNSIKQLATLHLHGDDWADACKSPKFETFMGIGLPLYMFVGLSQAACTTETR